MTISNTSTSANNSVPSTSTENSLQATCETFQQQMRTSYSYTLYDHPKTQTLLNNPSLSAKLKYNILYAGLTKSDGKIDPQFDTINLNGEELAKIFTLMVDYVAHCKNNSLTWEVQGFGFFKEKMIQLIALLSHSNPDKYSTITNQLEAERENPAISTAIADIKAQVVRRFAPPASPTVLVNAASSIVTASSSTPPPRPVPTQGRPTDEIMSKIINVYHNSRGPIKELINKRIMDPSTPEAIENAESIEIVRNSPLFTPSTTYNTNIMVLTTDTITAIKDLQAASPEDQVCVLSMAHSSSIGAGPQEKTLHTNTNLDVISLKFTDASWRAYDSKYSLIDQHNQIRQIFAPSVSLYTNNSKIAVIAAAPDNRGSDYRDNQFSTIIRGILLTAAQKGQKNLVLGAIGCGIPNVNKEHIAQLFKDYLEKEFKGVFKNVIFAIYDASTASIFRSKCRS